MIRDFDATDVESVCKLLSHTPEAIYWSADDLLQASRRNLTLRVAQEAGAVCGLIVFRVIADEAEILNLAVDLTHRRRGIASRLIGDAIGACRAAGAKKIFLEVRDSNQAARNLYARAGFLEAGRRRQYYRQPLEDAVVLVRTV
jgi:[ribosomal protein S18]-alanine N-acetyltransferase